MVSYSMGQDVEANYAGKGQWLEAKVLGCRDDGTFDLLYSDGDGESAVPPERLRAAGSGPEHSSGGSSTPGPSAASPVSARAHATACGALLAADLSLGRTLAPCRRLAAAPRGRPAAAAERVDATPWVPR